MGGMARTGGQAQRMTITLMLSLAPLSSAVCTSFCSPHPTPHTRHTHTPILMACGPSLDNCALRGLAWRERT
jgi:hypothetical protein